jgi:hypothetical protein
MRRVIIESPYGSKWFFVRFLNRRYARKAMRDCFRRGEAPFASHLLYTQMGVLRDSIQGERMRGIRAGLIWGASADAIVVYTDRGISEGMKLGIGRAQEAGRPVEYRTLNGKSK